ncbi:Coenzyme F420 hydrogenase/dehydrogenase, beta subunit C-terminal domain [Jannaschia sp. R86511]|uniref:Coenzyme F420 hydrogenase/dehydrogenase, beta subunit C-terminal domain n=1 Tax=Jannaschia sp. R86511 TaxID=3093853 RepID=UPI0036D37248
MQDDVERGLRPRLRPGRVDEETAVAADFCPGAHITRPVPSTETIASLRDGWGDVLELWEGYAADPDIRLAGSSGGVVTALGLHAATAAGLGGVVHTTADPADPLRSVTVRSTNREDLLRAAGSRYAPAGPCDRLDLVEEADRPVLVVGKPCDVAGLSAAAAARPRLAAGVAATVAVFCAGTPTTRGTLEMLAVMGVSGPEDVASLRYRGNGWPGHAVAVTRSGVPAEGRLTYDGSWNRVLQRHRQWRCRLCPDHTGELADVSVGDPWYREIEEGDPGRSLVVVRTARGRDLVRDAVAAGHLVLERVPPEVLPASQPNLLRTRGAVAARVATLRAVGAPHPRFDGFPMWRFWWSELPVREKLRSTLGTLRRSRRRRRTGASA